MDKLYKNILKEQRFPNGPRNDGQTNAVMIPSGSTLIDVVDVTFETDAVAAIVSASLNTTIYAVVASLNIQTGSQDSVNLAISTSTGSLNGVSSALMEYTSSLKAETIFSGSIQIGAGLTNYADDAAAQAGGVPIGGLYHTSGAVKVRLV